MKQNFNSQKVGESVGKVSDASSAILNTQSGVNKKLERAGYGPDYKNTLKNVEPPTKKIAQAGVNKKSS